MRPVQSISSQVQVSGPVQLPPLTQGSTQTAVAGLQNGLMKGIKVGRINQLTSVAKIVGPTVVARTRVRSRAVASDGVTRVSANGIFTPLASPAGLAETLVDSYTSCVVLARLGANIWSIKSNTFNHDRICLPNIILSPYSEHHPLTELISFEWKLCIERRQTSRGILAKYNLHQIIIIQMQMLFSLENVTHRQ